VTTSAVTAAVAADEFIAVVQADVVEWPRLSQAVRLEREAATEYYSVWKPLDGNETAIFYTLEAAERYAIRNDCFIDRKPILRQF